MSEQQDSKSDDETDSNDSSLDVTSVKFDPLKALYSSKMKIPVKNAPIYDNIAIFSSKMKAGMLGKPHVGKTGTDKDAAEKKRLEQLAAKNARRFQPHQMPIECKREFVGRNILNRMENMVGPLGRLKCCMDSRIRIKVVTRHHSGVRGYCIGYLQAFDKLWNLAMSDVTEVWTRKVKKKVPAALDLNELTEELRKKLNLNSHKPPNFVVTPAKKGYETCERHIPQLMMRGEHVVVIVILNQSDESRPSTSKQGETSQKDYDRHHKEERTRKL